MITKSQFNTFGYWLAIISMIGGSSFLIYLLFLNNDLSDTYRLIFPILVVSILLIIYGKLLWDSNNITIDTEAKSIIFQNKFTRKENKYQLDYFDGYLIINEPIKFGFARNIYFVKGNKLVYRISNFLYSNQPELEAELSSIKYLGEIKYSYLNSLKILFGKAFELNGNSC